MVVVTGLDVTVVVAVVAGAVDEDGAALGPGWAPFVEQAPRTTTRTSAEAPMTMGRGLTTEIHSPRNGVLRGTNRLRS